MKQILFILVSIITLPLSLSAETADSIPALSISDTTEIAKPQKKKSFLGKLANAGEAIFNYINEVDSNYIRPQEYNWAVMLQSTTTFESYKFQGNSGESITFSPKVRTKIGPYAGWRWAFLGYTFDVNKMYISEYVDINLSLYSSIFNIDFIWRDSGKNYKINSATVNTNRGVERFENIYFPGIETFIHGFNFNYVLKHKKFSYPAAFSQSSCQIRSAGSPIVGISYMHHRLNYDNEQMISTLNVELNKRYPNEHNEVKLDSTFNFNNIVHGSLTFSGGYAYNKVVTKNFIIGASLTAGIGFKRSIGDNDKFTFPTGYFKLKNVNFDGCGRFAMVYNNMKWFAGTSAILHYYSYNKGEFHTANWLANINIYAGFNFGRRKK